jgi:protein-S-isoprenylcysteine O-methyltransferase Ste14
MFALKLIAGVAANVLIVAIPLFAVAGTFDWWRAWIIVGFMLVGSTFGVTTLPRGLVEERMKPPVQKDQPVSDRFLVLAFLAEFVVLLVITPLDVFHAHFFRTPPTAVSNLGLALFLAGFWIAYEALRENAFAAPVVRHQVERAQSVVSSGLYGVVRHPVYAGGLLVMFGLAFWLQSYAGALVALLAAATLVARIHVEERFLQRQLPGYDDYVRRVRYRLVPFVW